MGALNQSTITESMIELRRQSLHLDEPIFFQYLYYLKDTISMDLGVSWSGGMPVADLLRAAMPHTFALTICAFSIACGLGIAIGIPQGLRKEKNMHLDFIKILLLSVPPMLFGTFLIIAFSIILPVFPSSGQGGAVYLVMPSLAAGLGAAGSISQWVESSLKENREAIFIKLAEAKGLSKRNIINRHILRVSLLPLINSGLMLLSFLFSGTVVVETLFARSGLGRLLVKSILESDIPVVQATIAVSAFFYLTAALLADILHAILDPRIRLLLEKDYSVI